MADEIVPRRKRILDSGPKKLPDINSLLKDSTKPEFLQKTDNSIFIEKEKVHGSQPATTVVNAPKSSATITKGAEIHKFPVTKDAENSNKKFQNFVDYMELRDIAGENNEDYVSMSAAVNQPEAQLGYSQRDATFGLDDPPQNMTGGLHKGSKPIRRGDKKNAVKDKEKARRMKGQSSIATWKPEAFMKMRQEFD